MEKFYRNRLERFANSRITMYNLLLEKLLVGCAYITSRDEIKEVFCEGLTLYLVPSEADPEMLYEVAAVLGVCSCAYGMDGWCCKHQIVVYKWFTSALPNLPPVTALARYEVARLELGNDALDCGFYESCKSGSNPIQNSTGMALAIIHVACIADEPSCSSTTAGPLNDCVDDCNHDLVVSDWKSVSERIEGLLQYHASDFSAADMRNSFQQLGQRLNNIHTGSQLCSFFHSFGQTAPRRFNNGAMIRTQPTAASRRKQLGITRGAKRQLGGRPAKGETSLTAKRPRCLARNIDASVPNAKSHGHGH